MSGLIGQTLGPYRILEQIGRGGMATVYKAYHAATDRYVAIKVLPDELAQEPTFLARFEREAHVVASLQHINILPVFDYGEEHGIAYLVMPYVSTGTLKQFLQTGPPSLEQTGRLFNQIAEAVDYAHRQGVIHRDIKPANVLLDASRNALLTDFGLTRMTESISSLTGAGVIGTPAYMSPEQGLGTPIDERSDIYSLGVVLYEMLVGDVPYSADTPVAVIYKHVSAALPPPRSRRPDLSENVERVVLKALAKKPEDRFETARELGEVLRTALAESAVSSLPPFEKPVLNLPDGEETIALAAPNTGVREPESSLIPKAGTRKPARRTPVMRGGAVLVLAAAFIAALMLSGVLDGSNDTQQPTVPTSTVEAAIGAQPTGTLTQTARPTNTASPLHTATPATPLAVVVAPRLSVRSGPGSQYPVITQLNAADRLEVTGVSADGRWLQVLLPDGTLGWVIWSNTFMDAFGNMAAVPTVFVPTVTPTNTPTVTHTPTLTYSTTFTPTNTPTDRPSATPTWTPSPVHTPSPTHQSQAVSPGFPPEGGEQVVNCEAGICIQSPESGEQWVVLEADPTGLELGYGMSFSPDGQQIAFSAMRQGGDIAHDNRLWITNREGADPIELSGSKNSKEPAWSPDGNWLAYHSECNLELIRPDGTGRRILLDARVRQWCVGYPEWSPDGQWIVVVGNPIETDGTSTRRDLMIVAADGSTLYTIEISARNETCNRHPAFSPDGTQIVYIDSDCLPVVINADGTGDPIPLMRDPWWWRSDAYPQWEQEPGIAGETAASEPISPGIPPEGAAAVDNCTTETGADAICVFPLVGEGEGRAIVELPVDVKATGAGITWSPDGRQLAFTTHDASTGQNKLYVVNRDGTNLHQLSGYSDPDSPAWSPDGQQIAIHDGCNLSVVRADGSGAGTV